MSTRAQSQSTESAKSVSPFPVLIETQALAERLQDLHLRLVDASWHMPSMPNIARNAAQEFQAKHLPGAVFFDIDVIADTGSPLPHMLPTPDVFESHMRRLGIGSEDWVVVYDTHGLMSSPRAWWTFRYFGHERVSVLNGGLPKWEREGRPLASGPVDADAGQRASAFKAVVNSALLKTFPQVLENIENKSFQLLDVRSPGRFYGQEPEPRPGLRSGHVPGSKNLAWNAMVDPQSQTLLPPDQLAEMFKAAGVAMDQPVACSCGSGITACMGALALAVLGHDQAAVYDGAWAEWGAHPDAQIESQ